MHTCGFHMALVVFQPRADKVKRPRTVSGKYCPLIFLLVHSAFRAFNTVVVCRSRLVHVHVYCFITSEIFRVSVHVVTSNGASVATIAVCLDSFLILLFVFYRSIGPSLVCSKACSYA